MFLKEKDRKLIRSIFTDKCSLGEWEL